MNDTATTTSSNSETIDNGINMIMINSIVNKPKYPWFQRPAPTYPFTLGMAVLLLLATFVLYRKRVEKIKTKMIAEGVDFTGSLRTCTKISAYMDHHEEPGFAILRVCAKSFLFLGLCQWHYKTGFVSMMVLLLAESSLDSVRVLLAYRNCKRLSTVSVIAEDEAQQLRSSTSGAAITLEPTNVYEDLTRPRSIAVLVFLTQLLLIGLVMDDSLRTTTRSCFDGHDGCKVLTSLGSFCLYLLGTFMACVFYVGPRNSYGKKEQNPTYWLKLFLLSKESTSDSGDSGGSGNNSLKFQWYDAASERQRELVLEDSYMWRIWLRFIMSFLINGFGFLLLLHVLPIQVAGQGNAIGVVFRAVGMIYLVDLDDTAGNVMTLVKEDSAPIDATTTSGTYGTGFLSAFRRLGLTGDAGAATEGTSLL